MDSAPRLYPTMRCVDAETMIAWLRDVLGFAAHAVYRKDGKIVHAELAFGSSKSPDGVISSRRIMAMAIPPIMKKSVTVIAYRIAMRL